LLNEPPYRSRPLAGGTDLLIQIRRGNNSFDRVVDITRIPELREIQVRPDQTVVLGAAVRVAEILDHEKLVEKAPLLAQACAHFGGPQIRNLATIGGNVINQAACADLLPVLVCLDAQAVVASPEGEFSLPVAGLIAHPFPRGRLVRTFTFSLPPQASRSVYLRLARRQTLATARLSLAALGRQSPDGTIQDARLVPGAVFARVRRISPVEALLVGQHPGDELFEMAEKKMIELYLAESGQRWSAFYKEAVLYSFLHQALRAIYAN